MKNEENQYFVGHTRFDQWATGLLCLLLATCFFLPLSTGWGPWDVMLYFYLGLGLIFSFLLRRFLQTFNHLHLYREGIEILRPFKHAQFLFWDEIAQIRGGVWRSDLMIANREGTISCRVNSSYTHADVLLHLLLSARPDLFQTGQRLTFTISPIPVILLVVIVIQLVFYSTSGVLASSTGSALLILLTFFLVVSMGMFLVIPYSVSILNHQLVFRFPFRKTVLNAGDVASIQKTTRFDFIYEWGEVTIHEKNGKVTSLMFYHLGCSLLWTFLASWHQMNTQPRLAAGDALEPTPVRGHRRLSENAPYLLPEKIDTAVIRQNS